jgi:hypothetical protein
MMAVAESTPELLLARSLTVYVPGAEKSSFFSAMSSGGDVDEQGMMNKE